MKAIAALSEFHQQIIRFERRWFQFPGTKLQAIHDTFHLTPVTYYRHLAEVLELPAAVWADPMTVNRLRRQQQLGLRSRRWRL